MNNRRVVPSTEPSKPTVSVGSAWSFVPEDELKDYLKKFRYAYIETINKLIRFDKQRIFRFPVDTTQVPDYTNIIKKPMDFETMLNKNEADTYKDDLKIFDDDVALIVNNCKTYNSRDTIFYDAALKLEDFYSRVRPLLLKKIATIVNLMNRRYLLGPKPRQRPAPTDSLSPSSSSLISQPSQEVKQYLPAKQETVMFSLPSTESIDSQVIKTETSDSSSVYTSRKRKKKVEQPKPRPAPTISPEVLPPAGNTIQIALSVSGLTNETFGKLMANFNGLPRLLNSLDVAQHQLVMNHHARQIYGPNSIDRLRRIISHFEWKRSFDFPLANGKNTLYRKIQLLMGRYRRDTYKKSVEAFIGEDNLDHINEAFPNLSTTLNDLCIPYQMLSNTTELKY